MSKQFLYLGPTFCKFNEHILITLLKENKTTNVHFSSPLTSALKQKFGFFDKKVEFPNKNLQNQLTREQKKIEVF